MSTKVNIACSRNRFHLYHEIFDDENVYIELTGVEFRATPQNISVQIPLEIWEVVRTRAPVRLSWAGKSDDDVRAHVEREVDERIEQARQGKHWLSGSLVYGAADRPREEQIRAGMRFLMETRDRQTRIAQAIQVLEAEQWVIPEDDSDESDPAK